VARQLLVSGGQPQPAGKDLRRYRRFAVRAFAASVLLVLAAIAVPAEASAQADAKRHHPVVAHGRSHHHVPWHVRGERARPDALQFDFFIDPPGYSDAGYGIQLPYPVPHGFVFGALTGSDIDPYPESDLSGIAARRVHRLVVKMNKGRSLRFHPRLAPRRIREQFKWVRGLRFFDRFYSSRRRPRVVKALDAEGHVLARRRSNQGSFF
jgi:hypothetical protein